MGVPNNRGILNKHNNKDLSGLWELTWHVSNYTKYINCTRGTSTEISILSTSPHKCIHTATCYNIKNLSTQLEFEVLARISKHVHVFSPMEAFSQLFTKALGMAFSF